MRPWPVYAYFVPTADAIFTTDELFSNPHSVSTRRKGVRGYEARADARDAAGDHQERLAGMIPPPPLGNGAAGESALE